MEVTRLDAATCSFAHGRRHFIGVSTQGLRQKIADLKPLFVARNQIAHELDLRRPEHTSDKNRRARGLNESRRLAYEGLAVGQLIINEVAEFMNK
jgi:hypothetical protein